MKKAIYPGSFDPITNGHLDILKRASKVFDEITVLIAINPAKKPYFDIETKKAMIEEAIKENGLDNVKVDAYEGLTVDYALKHDSPFLIRGLRAVTDFEYEFQMNSANEYISKEVETIFFMARNDTSFISSSIILELYENKVDISSLVPHSVIKRLK